MLDQNTIATYFGNDTSMLRKFVLVFIQESPALINAMDEALLSSDLSALALHAHTLKSQLKYFGYPALVQQLEEIERLADNQAPPEQLAGLLPRFNQAFQEAYQSLSAIST